MNQNTELVKRLGTLIELSERAGLSEGTWRPGVAGNCNLVAYNGEDVVGIALVPYEPRVDFIAALVNWFRANALTISTRERVIVELREVLKLTNETLKEQAKRFNTINYSHSEIDTVVSMIDVALSKGSGQ